MRFLYFLVSDRLLEREDRVRPYLEPPLVAFSKNSSNFSFTSLTLLNVTEFPPLLGCFATTNLLYAFI